MLVLEARPRTEPRIDRYYRLEDGLRLPALADRRGGARARAPRSPAGSSRRALGAFLSGGLDSTAVVALMRRLRAAPPRTYSMAIPDLEYFDESPGARLTASSRNRASRGAGGRRALQSEIPSVLDRLDEPFADSSALASSVIAREARRDLTGPCRVTAATRSSEDTVCTAPWRLHALSCPAAPGRRRPCRPARTLPVAARRGAAGAARRARRLLAGVSSELAAPRALDVGQRHRRAGGPCAGSADRDLGRGLVEERYRSSAGGSTRPGRRDRPAAGGRHARQVDRTSMSTPWSARPFSIRPSSRWRSRCRPRAFLAVRGKAPAATGAPRHRAAPREAAPKRGFECRSSLAGGPLAGLYSEVVTPRALETVAGVDHAVASAWMDDHRRRLHDRGAALWALFALCWWHRGPPSRPSAGRGGGGGSVEGGSEGGDRLEELGGLNRLRDVRVGAEGQAALPVLLRPSVVTMMIGTTWSGHSPDQRDQLQPSIIGI